MTTKITSLTEEQWAQIHAACERYLEIGRTTEPADRETTERCIVEMYADIGKERPKFFWLDGPLSCVLAAPIVAAAMSSQLDSRLDSRLDSLASQLDPQLDSLMDSLSSQLDSLSSQLDSLSSQLASQLDSLSSQLCSQLYLQLYPQLDPQLYSQLASQLASQLYSLCSQLDSQLYSQMDSQLDSLASQLDPQLDSLLRRAFRARWSPWWSTWWWHLSAYRDVCGVRFDAASDDRLRRWSDLMCASGWFFVFDGFVLCAERPGSMHVDDRGRLHCEDGPALRCRDGYEIWSWHGTRVGKRVIMKPESFTADELAAERNSEVHRVIGERIGWDKYIELLGVETIDEWVDPETQLTYSLLEPRQRVGDLQPRYLKMLSPPLHDGTQPHFIEPVHPELTSAQAARKWQVQLSSDPCARMYRHGDVVVTYADPDTLFWPTPEFCNANPELRFAQEA